MSCLLQFRVEWRNQLCLSGGLQKFGRNDRKFGRGDGEPSGASYAAAFTSDEEGMPDPFNNLTDHGLKY